MLRRTHTAALWQTEITARLRAALRGRSRTGSCWEGGRSGAKAESRNCVHARLPNCLRRPWGSPPRSTSHAEHLGYPTRAKLRQKCSDERTQQLYGRPKSLCPPCGSEGLEQCSKRLQSAARSGALESVTLQQLRLPCEHFPPTGASELGPACCHLPRIA